tara:strand:- start:1282 stop:1509 length:228 start_codon:yes stop_codon:yes gene_type:complete
MEKLTGKRIHSIGDPDTDWLWSLSKEESNQVLKMFNILKPKHGEKPIGCIVLMGTAGEVTDAGTLRKMWEQNKDK